MEFSDHSNDQDSQWCTWRPTQVQKKSFSIHSFNQLEDKLESRAGFCSLIGIVKVKKTKTQWRIWWSKSSIIGRPLVFRNGWKSLDMTSQCSFCSDCMKHQEYLKNASSGNARRRLDSVAVEGWLCNLLLLPKKGDVVEKVCKRSTTVWGAFNAQFHPQLKQHKRRKKTTVNLLPIKSTVTVQTFWHAKCACVLFLTNHKVVKWYE